jgi:hypothetical protein
MIPTRIVTGARGSSSLPRAYYEKTAGNAAGSLAVRRQRSEPQAAVARRGWCSQARRLEQRLRSPGRIACYEHAAGNAACPLALPQDAASALTRLHGIPVLRAERYRRSLCAFVDLQQVFDKPAVLPGICLSALLMLHAWRAPDVVSREGNLSGCVPVVPEVSEALRPPENTPADMRDL